MPDDDLTQVQQDELPSTVERSEAHAQATYAKTLDNAEEQYGKGERASRTAWASLKHTYEKTGDHWEPKQDNGDSDPDVPANPPGDPSKARDTHGGVDAGKTKDELYDQAQDQDVPGRSSMTKDELVEAIDRDNQKKTAHAREACGRCQAV